MRWFATPAACSSLGPAGLGGAMKNYWVAWRSFKLMFDLEAIGKKSNGAS